MNGTAAEYVVVPAENVLPIPDLPDDHAPLTWAEAAAFGLVGLTAWHMLAVRARVHSGETVLIWGIGGGVSSMALQIAKVAGARVIATSSSQAKLDYATAQGADLVLDHTTDDVVAAVRAFTGRRGVDVVVENVGEATWERSLKVMGRGGRLVTCGATTGPKVSIDLRRLFWYQWDILGSTMGGVEDFREAVRLLGQGKLRPVIDTVFPLTEGAEAVARLESGAQLGKVAIAVQDDALP